MPEISPQILSLSFQLTPPYSSTEICQRLVSHPRQWSCLAFSGEVTAYLQTTPCPLTSSFLCGLSVHMQSTWSPQYRCSVTPIPISRTSEHSNVSTKEWVGYSTGTSSALEATPGHKSHQVVYDRRAAGLSNSTFDNYLCKNTYACRHTVVESF